MKDDGEFFWKYPYKNVAVSVSSWREDTKDIIMTPNPLSQWSHNEMCYKRKTKPLESKFNSLKALSLSVCLIFVYFGESRLKHIKIILYPFMLYISSMHSEGLTPKIHISVEFHLSIPPPKNITEIKRSSILFSPKHLSNLRKLRQ